MTNYKNIKKYCLCCGNELKLNNTRDIERKKFCSKECNGSYLLKKLWKNENYIKIITDAASKPNPKKASKKFTTPINKCCNCDKDIRKNIGKSKLVYCSINCYNEYRKNNIVPREDSRKKVKLTCNFCGKDYELPPSIAKNSKYCGIQCHNISNYINMPFKNTKIEIILDNVLANLGIKYNKQKPISNKTIPDFFIEPNIAIYADGDYWHGLPHNIEKDKKNKQISKRKWIYRYKI